ncbi:MAG: hypothetical protein Q7S28_00500 [bacterium]|nr:hypothetical protein [bacterium]
MDVLIFPSFIGKLVQCQVCENITEITRENWSKVMNRIDNQGNTLFYIECPVLIDRYPSPRPCRAHIHFRKDVV